MDSHGPRRLFLIDDDAHVLAALKFSFEADQYEVVTLTSGEALLAEPHREAACIVIDQRLPGLTGLETLARLRASGVVTPAILITTHPSRAVRERAAKMAADIIEKPLTGDALPRRVAALTSVHTSL